MSNVLERLMRFSTNIAMLVSSPSKVDRKVREAILPRATRSLLVEAARLAADRRIAVGMQAEISLRLPGDKMAINARDAWFGHVQDEDFCVAALRHERTFANSRPPARHAAWHVLIYNATPAEAVLLCQPTATAVYARRLSMSDPDSRYDFSQDAAGTVGFVHPTAEEITAGAAASQVLLIEGNGMLVWGNTLIQVLGLAEAVIHSCELYLAEQNLRS